MTSKPITEKLGMALSGGASRAAAFHRGTLQALTELGLEGQIDVVSTVSGGSVFGAAWMLARRDGISDADFLEKIRQELKKGFVGRSVRPRILKTLIPGLAYSRTNAIAQTFDEAFFQGRTLKDLPESPHIFREGRRFAIQKTNDSEFI